MAKCSQRRRPPRWRRVPRGRSSYITQSAVSQSPHDKRRDRWREPAGQRVEEDED
jgi:hypothetical protein